MNKSKVFSILISVSLLASCGLINSNDNAKTSSSSETETTSSKTAETSSKTSNETENSQDLTNFSDEEVEYARVWLNFGNNKNVDELSVTLIPKGSLINPNNVNYGVYKEDVVEVRGPQESDGNVVYSVDKENSGYINIYSVPYNFEEVESRDNSQFKNLNEDTENVYIEPGENQVVSQLIETLNISERDSFMTMNSAINLYEEGIKDTSNGEMTSLESEFYNRDYFAIAQDEPSYLMLSFENQGRGGQDFCVFRSEGDTILIDTYFETYDKDEPDNQWIYDINTMTFTEKNSQNIIDPFTEETAFEYIKEQEGFDDDIAVEFSEIKDDGSIEITLASKKAKNAGGSGTVDTFVIYPNGDYYSKNNKKII